jgi:ABC-type lipoprotein export system ATPase subunit
MNPAQNNRETEAKRYLDLFQGDKDAAIAFLMRTGQSPTTKTQPKIANTNPVVVRIEDVSKQYKLGRQHVAALKKVSLQIREGEFVALTGPSGSGKSTLLQLIGGLDKPSDGRVVINEHDISRLSDRKLSVFRNKTIGFVFQFFYLQPFLSLQTNLEVPGMFARTKPRERRGRSQELAGKVGLSERLKHRPKELSGGQMQRAAIARALLNSPKIVLADEPTGNLDSANGQAIIDLFEEIRNTYGTTIVVVTHDPKIAARADREIILKDGEVAI